MGAARLGWVGVALAAMLWPGGARPAAGVETEAGNGVAGIVASGRHPWLSQPDLRDFARELAELYPADQARPIWFEGAQPAPALLSTVRALGDAGRLGLDPADLDADRLLEEARRSSAGQLPAPDRALLDVALSVQWMRYLRAAHAGRIPMHRAGRGADLPDRPLDLPALVRTTRTGGDAAAVLASVEPRHPGYVRLKAALARQKLLAAAAPLPEVPLPARKVEPGAEWEGIPALRARLSLLGDLPASSAPPQTANLYDPALVAAVKRFQNRHLLGEDGVIGKGTVAAMNVPAVRRIRQIELSLERWRWLPDPGRREVVVELPRAEMWALDLERGTTDLHMRTVVGEAHSHATPMIASSITSVVFRPYWVPPPKILKEEILPKAKADPAWLAGQNMEIVARPEEGAEPIEPTEDVLAQVSKGELILRQRPGPRNSLGTVKFVVPDSQCIGLHGTPHKKTFDLPHRDRSHGCIRLEDPDALARWVLVGEPGWDAARIAAASDADTTTPVRLREPVGVVLVYGTATVDPDGTEHYVDDLYHLDAQAEAELARQRGR